MREPDTLQALVAWYHREIEDTFLLHQEALLLGDLPLAREGWALAAALLDAHIAVEDQQLLPLAPLVRERFAPTVYAAEHAKIRDLLAEAGRRLAALDIRDRRAVIALIDYQRVLKNVLEHHETREEQGLLPGLDTLLPADRHAALLAEVGTAWSRVRSALAGRRDALRQALAGR